MVSGPRLPRIYWINLARSPARRARMQKALEEHALHAVRIVASDGRSMAQRPDGPARIYESIGADGSVATARDRIRCRADNPLIAACLLSHLRAIRSAYDAGDECAVFMEDDASFELYARWPGDFESVLSTLPSHWSALWLGYGDTPRHLDQLFQLSGWAVPVPQLTLWSTVAYVLHRRAMEHVLSRYDRGDLFDVTGFDSAHEADTLLLRTLTFAEGLAPPHVLRVPMFTFEGADSEIHDADLRRQRRARAFVLAAFDELATGTYASRFTLRARIERTAQRLGGWLRRRAAE